MALPTGILIVPGKLLTSGIAQNSLSNLLSTFGGTRIGGFLTSVSNTIGITAVLREVNSFITIMSKASTFFVLFIGVVVSTVGVTASSELLLFLSKIIIVYGFLLTAINIFITLLIAREIAKLLGTTIELSAFMKIL